MLKFERRVELAFEGLRLFDLYRWKELDKAVANIENERTMYGLAYEARKFNGERDYVWPLPTAELDTNKKLVQARLVEVMWSAGFHHRVHGLSQRSRRQITFKSKNCVNLRNLW